MVDKMDCIYNVNYRIMTKNKVELLKKVKEFLQESNNIENVWDTHSLTLAKKAWGYLISQNELTVYVINKTHGILMKGKLPEHEAGHFRRCPVWIGGKEALNCLLVPDATKHWCFNVNDLLINAKNEPEVFLERMIKEHHVRYEGIHPHVDGNGRIGRMLLNWQRVKHNLPILVIKEKDKQKYYRWFK